MPLGELRVWFSGDDGCSFLIIGTFGELVGFDELLFFEEYLGSQYVRSDDLRIEYLERLRLNTTVERPRDDLR